jgi:hypothetical protein
MDPTQTPNCVVDERTCEPTFDIISATTAEETFTPEPGVLYYIQNLEKYFYILEGIDDERRYSFAITAIDDNDEESPSFNVPTNENYHLARADVPPGIARITAASADDEMLTLTINPVNYNIDGSPGEGVTNYAIYCFDENAFDENVLDRTDGINLSTKTPVFARSAATVGENIVLTREITDFDETTCGLDDPTDMAVFVVAGVRGTRIDPYPIAVTENAVSMGVDVNQNTLV